MSNLLKNTSIYTLGNLLPQIAGFFLLPIYTRYLTPEDFGIVGGMEVLFFILAIMFTFATERSANRLYWDYTSEKEKKDYLGTVIITQLSISVTMLLLLFLLREFVSLTYRSIPFYPYYAYTIFAVFFMVFSYIPKIYWRLEQKAVKFVTISIIQFILRTGCIIWFVVWKKTGAGGMLMGQMFGHALMVPFFVVSMWQIANCTVRFNIIKESLKFSVPMMPVLLSGWVMSLSNRIFIERYFSLSDVGIYSLSHKIASLVLIVVNAFAMAYNPLFYQLANSPDQDNAKRKLYVYNNAYVMSILLICFLISFFSREAILILFDPRFAEAYKIIPIIVLGFFIYEGSGLLNLSIYQEKKTVAMMFIMLGGAILNIIFNFLLVPSFGAYGAAYAMVISYTGIFIIKYRYAKKCYYIPYQAKHILFSFAFLIMLMLTFADRISNIYLSLFMKVGIVSILLAYIMITRNKHLQNLIKPFTKTRT